MVNAEAVGSGPDRVGVVFDDERAVASAGIVLPAALAGRLGIEALVDRSVVLGDRPGAANAGAKVMTLISAMALGADCIDDCEILRAGRTSAVVGHSVAAPSTLDVLAVVYVWACPPARPGIGRDAHARMGGGRRPGRGAAGR